MPCRCCSVLLLLVCLCGCAWTVKSVEFCLDSALEPAIFGLIWYWFRSSAFQKYSNFLISQCDYCFFSFSNCKRMMLSYFVACHIFSYFFHIWINLSKTLDCEGFRNIKPSRQHQHAKGWKCVRTYRSMVVQMMRRKGQLDEFDPNRQHLVSSVNLGDMNKIT